MGTSLTVRDASLGLAATPPQQEFLTKLAPYLAQVSAVVPRHLVAEHYLSLLLRAATEQPKILACSPESVVIALVDVIRWRLEIGRTVHLVPYGTKLQAIIDYKGYIQLMVNSKHVRDVSAEVVYSTDAFEWSLAEQRVLRHDRLSAGTPEQITGAYAVALLPHGHRKYTYLTREQIEARRACSKQPDGEKWSRKNYVSACKTSTIREMQKYMPQEASAAIPWDADEPRPHVFESVPMVSTGAHPYGAEAMSEATDTDSASTTPSRPQPPAIDWSARLTDENDGELLVTSDDEEVAFAPECPICGGDMWDNRASKTNPKQPDFKCKKAPKSRGGPGCEGVIWPPRGI